MVPWLGNVYTRGEQQVRIGRHFSSFFPCPADGRQPPVKEALSACSRRASECTLEDSSNIFKGHVNILSKYSNIMYEDAYHS
jgi:hypothetical protein